MSRYHIADLLGDKRWKRYLDFRTQATSKFGRIRQELKLPKMCADCYDYATCWDHRDYFKPAKVEPVCRSCNYYRGPAWATIRKLFGFDYQTIRRMRRLYHTSVWGVNSEPRRRRKSYRYETPKAKRK